MKQEILLLGDETLYQTSTPAWPGENLSTLKTDLYDTLLAYRARYQAGRAIAAIQIGVAKRVILLCVDEPLLIVNPQLTFEDGEMMEVLDDCMSFPGLLVRVKRRRRCMLSFFDENWQPRTLRAEGDLAELLQHEYDHLDGILATMRAVDNRSLVWQRQP